MLTVEEDVVRKCRAVMRKTIFVLAYASSEGLNADQLQERLEAIRRLVGLRYEMAHRLKEHRSAYRSHAESVRFLQELSALIEAAKAPF